MDSLTQFALGAGIGVAVLGRRIGPRRAAIAGGLLGSVPDLDVFYPFDDPVDAFVLHRSATHSMVVQAAATPLFAEALMRVAAPLRNARGPAYLAVYLCFATHALLDAMTVYGTRLFWPLWEEPLAAGSVFIIDPLYTLPLLFVTVWALCLRSWTAPIGRVLAICLALSTAYLGWSLTAQRIVEDRAQAVLAEAGIAPERLLATPTAFNTLLWRAIAIDGDRYFNVYVPILGRDDGITVYAHPRAIGPAGCLDGNGAAARLASFSKGFYRVDRIGGEIVMSDLRMGLTPNYVFRFVVAEDSGGRVDPVAPRRLLGARQSEGDIDWLLSLLSGGSAVRPAEATFAVAALGPDGSETKAC
jgi:inner membrane protein